MTIQLKSSIRLSDVWTSEFYVEIVIKAARCSINPDPDVMARNSWVSQTDKSLELLFIWIFIKNDFLNQDHFSKKNLNSSLFFYERTSQINNCQTNVKKIKKRDGKRIFLSLRAIACVHYCANQCIFLIISP